MPLDAAGFTFLDIVLSQQLDAIRKSAVRLMTEVHSVEFSFLWSVILRTATSTRIVRFFSRRENS